MNELTKNNMKYFAVESPQLLVNQLGERYHKAEKLLPELLSLTNSLSYKPKIQYYEGLDGIKHIFEDTLNAQSEIVGYTNLEELPKAIPEDYLKDYAKRKIQAGIKTRMLSPFTKAATDYLKRYYPKDYELSQTEVLFINPDQYPFEYEINIYDDSVAIVSLNANEPVGMIIKSPLYARTERSVFNLAWLGATSFVAR
ncbi:hypothetical protein IPJ72_05735 [Candidatus Peregrinibacteria bacterium]|nr:MAG: hypothetical protein IPJ72_05735 [Candidatus Peregrinibacteria bacterium]